MFDVLEGSFFGNRLGVSYLKLSDFSIDRDLERALNSIQQKTTESPLGINRRLIQKFEYSSKKREVYLSALIEMPIKIKSLITEGQNIRIAENISYETRSLKIKIDLKNLNILFFAQSQKEVKFFVSYIRELTVMGFNPVQITIPSERMKNILEQFEEINQLKIIDKKDSFYMRFGGKNILNLPVLKEFLIDENNEIVDIFGTKKIPGNKNIRLHLNNKGRLWLYANPEDLTNEEINNLLKEIETICMN